MRRNKFNDQQKGFIFLGIIFLIIAAVSVYLGIQLSVGKDLEVDERGVIRTLIMVGDEEKNVLFTNVLIYYPETEKSALVNVPGNTGQIYTSLNRNDRIDAVYREKGIEVYKREIEKVLDCEIPYYVIMELNNFKKLTDMLGGLRVFIPSPVDVKNENGVRYLLPSGAVNLDGDKIEAYLKYVLPDETYSEVQERYQNVATAFLTSFHDKRSVVLGSESTFKKYYEGMMLNLDASDAYKLFKILAEVDTEVIKKQTITGRQEMIDGQLLLTPTRNGEDIKEAVKQVTQMLISNSGSMASRIYVLEILNGTSIQGLAHNTAILYKGASYDVLSPVNADRNDYEKTVIIDRIGNREMAEIVGNYIHCSNIEEESVDLNSDVANVDFTIILGRDFDGRYVR